MFYVRRPDGTLIDAPPGIDRVDALWNAAGADAWIAAHTRRNGTGNVSGAKRRGYTFEDADAIHVGRVALTIEALTAARFKVNSEEELQAEIARQLTARGLPFVREWHSSWGRIDFRIGHVGEPGIGVEVKIAGTPAAVRDQMERYAHEGQIRHLILATTRLRLASKLPDLLNMVPIEVVYLRPAL